MLAGLRLVCYAQNVGGSNYDAMTLEELVRKTRFSLPIESTDGASSGYVRNEFGTWEYGSGEHGRHYAYDSYKCFGDAVYVAFLMSDFDVLGEPSFREYRYPCRAIIKITRPQMVARLKGDAQNASAHFVSTIRGGASCRALVVADNVRIRSLPGTSFNSVVLGTLSKFSTIRLIRRARLPTVE